MKANKQIFSGILAACTMLLVILDTKTAVIGAKEGIDLCLQTVIPSLFPFFVLSGIINNRIGGSSLSAMRPITKLCKIPNGAESIMILGLTAGYPIGAQMIYQCYSQKQISKSAAKRMLGFCNNAGPAFIFGILTPLFQNRIIPWVLWGIHIITAIIVGIVIPSADNITCNMSTSPAITLPQALYKAIKTTAIVCAWILVFRIILSFCNRWFLWIFPISYQVLFSSLLELSNGCVQLVAIQQQGLRFILASSMLAFGGICVGLQTRSCTEELGYGKYYPGKVLQTLLSFLFSIILQPILFDKSHIVNIPLPYILLSFGGAFLLIHTLRRKSCRF